jgi:hypothetical protein
MKQQTAVEWLLNAIETKNGKEFSSYYTEFIEQAKEMEEQQMLEFWNGGIDCTEGGVSFDQYYNKTYKKE